MNTKKVPFGPYNPIGTVRPACTFLPLRDGFLFNFLLQGFGDMRKSSTTPMEVKALEGLYITAVTCGLSHTLLIARDESEAEKAKIAKLEEYSI